LSYYLLRLNGYDLLKGREGLLCMQNGSSTTSAATNNSCFCYK